MLTSPAEQCIVQTMVRGGVRALDVHTGKVLWHQGHVPPYAHLECSQGHLIVDDAGPSELQVWRRARAISADAARGSYRLVAKLSAPGFLCAFRFQYPVVAA